MQSFCWWCGKNLKLPFYTVVTDQLGHQQKIHKCCKAGAEKEVRPVTAQPKPNAGYGDIGPVAEHELTA